ncbi:MULTISPECIES: hypothetical protein [unclassified Brenneria]|uniref:hypothetical protein n=1 Tax=unclassified Brenneria TaxID=2634434 RepID=UPI0029C5B8F2|nr:MULTISPECIES: hypothetical protein [unclassified Brenneria]MDX5629984.1 hypothetical protein [Brenneria sp. L3-3Z]MDX5697130.1 hypothetical protein [Brenneria sp. L4-2C]
MKNIIPVDNCNLFPYESGIESETINIDINADYKSIGNAILIAFKLATYHPENKL